MNKIKIGVIGNCQTLTLCVYLKDILPSDYEIRWIEYSKNISPDYTRITSTKYSIDILTDPVKGIEYLKDADYIIYQPIKIPTTVCFTDKQLKEYAKPGCKLISFISIYIENHYTVGINELKKRETANDVTMTVTDIMDRYQKHELMLTKNHITSMFCIELVKKLVVHLGIDFFKDTTKYLMTNNYTSMST